MMKGLQRRGLSGETYVVLVVLLIIFTPEVSLVTTEEEVNRTLEHEVNNWCTIFERMLMMLTILSQYLTV